MRNATVVDLADWTESHQTLMAGPPRIVHGTALLLAALLGATVAWAALAEADLVVRAPGRVRPVISPKQVVLAGSGEVLSASIGGRVVATNFRRGDEVRRNDVLIRLDTARVDNEIVRLQRMIQAAEDELKKLAGLEELAARQLAAARAKADAELAQVRDEIQRERERRLAEVRLAQLERDGAVDELTRVRRLRERRAVAEVDLVKAQTRLGEAEEKLKQARVPVGDGRIEVLSRARTLLEEDARLRREEAELKRAVKQAALDASRIELANLELERAQAVLIAPIDGVVTTGDVKLGDILERGKPVLEIAERRGFQFEADVPSKEIGDLRVGMPARIRLDAYDDQRYGTVDGTVSFIAPDSNVSEESTRVTYLVKIVLKHEEYGRGPFRGRVKLGMAGQADIVTGRDSLLALLVKQLRQTISLG